MYQGYVAEEYIRQTAKVLISIFDLGQLPNSENLNKMIFDYYK